MAEAARETFDAAVAGGTATVFHCAEYKNAVFRVLNTSGGAGTITITGTFGFNVAGGSPAVTVLLANAVPVAAAGDEVFVFTREGIQGLHVDPGGGAVAALLWLYPIITVTCSVAYRVAAVLTP